MDQVDYDSFLTSTSNWLNPFDQQDAAYLTASRQILETITEETSEDEENNQNSWSQYEHSIWSSESETGSVIRMELNTDQDSISERDLACPAKRPRHDEFVIGGSITAVPACVTDQLLNYTHQNDINLRKFAITTNTNDIFDSGNSFPSNHFRKSKSQYDDFFSDSDSLSYNSLSRSSSLIQFESLERQFLNEQVNISSSFGNSSPSLLSFEGVDRGSNGCLKRYESTDSRLHQTYYDLDKINFEDNLLFPRVGGGGVTGDSSNKSDSESSDNSILSHEERIKNLNYNSIPLRSGSLSIPKGGRSSAENLSEDSGYSEGYYMKKSKSLQNFEHLNEHESFEKFQFKSNYGNIGKCTEGNFIMECSNTNNNTKIDQYEEKDDVHETNTNSNEHKNKRDGGDCLATQKFLSVSLPDITVRYNCRKLTEFSVDQFSSLPIDLQQNIQFNNNLNQFYCSGGCSDEDNCISSTSLKIPEILKMSANRAATELGKGNFLLDEISEHFNKNLSILNDREHSLDADEKYKKIIDTYIEREDNEEVNEDNEVIQHVKLTIRKPPRKDKLQTTIDQHLGKTFDQDPTNLKTSYATSLEKCNFDAKELSQQDLTKILPKRRFRTTQKKRGLVSSTPNLNNPDNDDDCIDDNELCISSAHASMHQLPPMGILVASGSKQSFGKEVSFCPVVSKYSWAEQSSEEYNELSTFTLNDNGRDHKADQHDNNDIDYNDGDITAFNTQYNADVIENLQATEADTVINRNANNISKTNGGTKRNSWNVTLDELDAEIENEKRNNTEPEHHHNFAGSVNLFTAIDSKTSNDTTIGQATSAFLDNEKLVVVDGGKNCNHNNSMSSNINNNNSNNNNKTSAKNCNNLQKMSNMTVKCSDTDGGSLNNNLSQTGSNNNYLLNSKFKVNEKSPSKGFLSRFASGFRFSLRRKKNKAPLHSQLPPVAEKTAKLSKPPSPDFIYIPLKGPLPPAVKNNNNNNGSSHVLVTGKPPLPKQSPPRIVGVSEKMCASPPAPHHQPQDESRGCNNRTKQQNDCNSSNHSFLENERSYYEFKNQLTKTMNTSSTKSAAVPYSTNFQNKIGLIETNLDTHETKISGKTRSLMELGLEQQIYNNHLKIHHQNGGGGGVGDGSNCDSGCQTSTSAASSSRRPHKSMEFLLDKENQKNVLPPENELQKTHENSTALSEHQLRVQASLQRLNIPDWFKQYNQSTPKPTENGGSYKPGNFSRKRASDSGRWTGLNSKTTSLSSLGSQKSERNLILLSPSAHSHHGGQTTAHTTQGGSNSTGQNNQQGQNYLGFSRWSTSHLNSTQTSPSASARSSFSRGGPTNSSFISVGGSSVRSSYRQPYLGWRSQEKLAQPRTPHERLASTLLATKPVKLAEQPENPNHPPLPPVIQHPAGSPEIQSSIKEVTSAIVHYVNDQTNRAPRSRSVSPNSRCWLESSFVGLKPVDSPQTPVIENSTSPFNTSNNSTVASKDLNASGVNGGVGESSLII